MDRFPAEYANEIIAALVLDMAEQEMGGDTHLFAREVFLQIASRLKFLEARVAELEARLPERGE
jgi:hypothetical protein